MAPVTHQDIEQALLDATAAMAAERNAHPYQRDIVALVRRAPQAVTVERKALERVIQSMSPTFLNRGGMPGNPTISLTVAGWLRSNLRSRVAAMAECVLRAYRNKADETAGAFEDVVGGSDLEATGFRADDIGLLAACGNTLQLFVNPSGLGIGAPLSNVRLTCPWDIEAILECPDAEAFFAYRSKYDLARVSALQSLEHTVTGHVRAAIEKIYQHATDQWPLYRAIEVELRRDRIPSGTSLASDFVRLVGDGEPNRRVALTFRGLHLASLSRSDFEAIMAAVHGAVAAYMAAPTRTEAAPAVVLGGLPVATQERALLLLEGVLPQLVARELSGAAEFRLGPWLLELADATTLEDVVVAVSPILRSTPDVSVDGSFPDIEDGPHPPDAQDYHESDEELTVGELVGTGAHADVYKVRQHRFERDIAAKVLKSEDESAVLNHARALARGRHPAVVHLYGVAHVTLPTTTRARALLMEYVGGLDLFEYLKKSTLVRGQVGRFADTIVRALSVLHKHLGFHGDLHDRNVRIVDDELRILDLYHRPSMLYATTKSLEAHQEHDRRECKNLIVQLLEASDFGGRGTGPYEAFQTATRSRTATLEDIAAGVEAALKAT